MSVLAELSVHRIPAGRRWAMSALALALLYGNAMVALQPPLLRPFGLFIPFPRVVGDAFVLSAMFASESVGNVGIEIQGRRNQTGRADDRGLWILLPLNEHLPLRNSYTTMQMYVPFHEAIGGEAGRQRAWAALARKIRANHNRLHPDRSVDQVRFGAVRWPRDPRGFYSGKVRSRTAYQVWFVEEPE